MREEGERAGGVLGGSARVREGQLGVDVVPDLDLEKGRRGGGGQFWLGK